MSHIWHKNESYMLYIDPWSRHGIATEHDRTSLRTLEIPSSQHVKLGLSTSPEPNCGESYGFMGLLDQWLISLWCPHCISVARSTKLPDSSISLNPDMFLQFPQPFPHKIPICPSWSPITFCWRWKQVDYYLAQLLSDQNCLAGGPNCSVKADVPKQRGCFTLFHITFCCVG